MLVLNSVAVHSAIYKNHIAPAVMYNYETAYKLIYIKTFTRHEFLQRLWDIK